MITHGTRWGYQQGCRCDACRLAESTYKREWSYRVGRSVPGRRGITYARVGIPVEAVEKELKMLVYIHGTQRRVAELLGVSETWVYRALGKSRGRPISSRVIQRVRLSMAQRIYELTRGGRNLAAEADAEQVRLERSRARDKTRVYALSKGPLKCRICPAGFVTEHGLYRHAFQTHGDKTQGKNSWSRISHRKPA